MSSALSVRLAAPPKRRRLLAALLAAQVCGSTGHSISLAVGSVVAAEITGSNTWSGVLAGSFPYLLLGMALFGIGNTSNLLSRYAAADVSPGAERGRAISLIVWGSAAGSIIGPNLLGLAAEFGGRLRLSTLS